MKKIFAVIILILSYVQVFSQTEHLVYFEDTDNELHVYKVNGRKPGNTIMILGGIHNEPGGYLAADHYVDLSLAKGNLIVVPRANFKSIIADKRGVNGDMNRKFADEGDTYEYKIVAIIKELINEADVFLNLHEGSGFYRPQYESPFKNPGRFGQSLIADADTFYHEESGRYIYLKDIGEEILANVNKEIENGEYRFHFNNHNTFDPKTIHPEQRKSATYYVLKTRGIPAFGVETSKNIPSLETKLRYQMHVINEFMKFYEVIPEVPGMYLDPPKLKFIVMSVKDKNPMTVPNNTHIHLNRGDEIEITHVESNYERGLAVDVLNYGSLNEFRKKIKINEDTRIIIYKDKFIAGNIGIRIGEPDMISGTESSRTPSSYNGFDYILLEINNKKSFFSVNEVINLTKGDVVNIINTVPAIEDFTDLRVNFYGYVPPGRESSNVAHDLGYAIDTEKELQPRYSKEGDGERYFIRVEKSTGGNVQVLETFEMMIKEPVFEFILLKGKDKRYHLENGESISLEPGLDIEISEIKTNISKQKGISVNLLSYDSNGDLLRNADLTNIAVKKFKLEEKISKFKIAISKGRRIFGEVFILVDKDMAKK